MQENLWPLQAIIVEIPVPVREWKNAVMLFACRLSTSKPDRERFLNLVVKQIERLIVTGIRIRNSRDHIMYNVRVQYAVFDLPARAHFVNIVQYNG
ncbi:unnamed protein product, partial [Didymodactylos carnosus]